MKKVLILILSIAFLSACAESHFRKRPTLIPEVKPTDDNKKKSPRGEEEPKRETFYVKDGMVYDPSNQLFVMRGVNNPHAYYIDKSLTALEEIKKAGFNSVRVVWCADNLLVKGRCDKKDIHPLSQLQELLTELRRLKMVAVLNLQNATGSNDPADLESMVDYLTKPEVRSLLMDFKDMLIINLANEWHGGREKSEVYFNAYEKGILRLRQAQIPHLLMIDARGWGQDFTSIEENFSEFSKLDNGLLFSVHVYGLLGKKRSLTNVFKKVRSKKIPLVVGEFSCSHSGAPVECLLLMKEASFKEYPLGYLVWSWSGNGGQDKKLDIVSATDWKTPTSGEEGWGEKILHGDFGITETSQEACFFTKATENCGGLKTRVER